MAGKVVADGTFSALNPHLNYNLWIGSFQRYFGIHEELPAHLVHVINNRRISSHETRVQKARLLPAKKKKQKTLVEITYGAALHVDSC